MQADGSEGTDRPIMHIDWTSAGELEQDKALVAEITEFALALLNGYEPNIWGALRPGGGALRQGSEGCVTE